MQAESTYSFDIGTLASMFGVTYRTLRFYEERGLICPVRKQGKRHYSDNDRLRVGLIIEGKRLGLNLKEIEEIVQREGNHLDASCKSESLETLIEGKQLEEHLNQMRKRKAEIELAINSLEIELNSRGVVMSCES